MSARSCYSAAPAVPHRPGMAQSLSAPSTALLGTGARSPRRSTWPRSIPSPEPSFPPCVTNAYRRRWIIKRKLQTAGSDGPFPPRAPHGGTPAFRNFASSGRGDGSRRSAVPRRHGRLRQPPPALRGRSAAESVYNREGSQRGRRSLWKPSAARAARGHCLGTSAAEGRARGYRGAAQRRAGAPHGPRPSSAGGSSACRPERTVGPGAAVPLRRGRWARAAGTARSVPGAGPLPPGSRRCPHCRSRPRAGASSPPRRGADGGREAPRVGPFPPGEPPPRTFCSSAEAGSGLSADMAPRQQHGGRGAAPPRSAAQRSSASAQDGGGSQDGAPAGPHFLRAQPPAARPRAQRLSGATFGVGPTLRYVTLTSGLPPRALIDYRKRCRVLFGAALVRALCGGSAHRGAAPTRGLRPCRYSAVRSAQGKHSAENAAVPWNCALREQT